MKKLASLLSLIGLLVIGAAQAQTVNVTLTPSTTSGVAPLSTTLTWSSTGADTCVASGGWSGTKPISGTQTITGITANTTFTLTCSTIPPAVLSWTPPTQNTDGSALTDLAGYKIYQGTTATSLASSVTVGSTGATSYSVTGLPLGTRFFSITAYNAGGLESAQSNVVSKNVVAVSNNASTTITIITKPQPPVGLTVQ